MTLDSSSPTKLEPSAADEVSPTPIGSTAESVPPSRPRKKRFRELFSRDELWYYGIAAVIYIALGILLTNLVLNWIVGPLFIVLWIWFVPPLVDRWRSRKP